MIIDQFWVDRLTDRVVGALGAGGTARIDPLDRDAIKQALHEGLKHDVAAFMDADLSENIRKIALRMILNAEV